MAHLYAMFLLAQFRETRAYPLVVRFASLLGDLTNAGESSLPPVIIELVTDTPKDLKP